MRLKKYLFFAFGLSFTLLMTAFAHYRNSVRLVEKITVEFEAQQSQFLNDSLVNKLLIQNKGALPWEAKDSLALSKLEHLLENDPYVKNADVYHFQQGVLGVRIQEKKAIIRIQGPKQYYMDSSGDFLPISKNYTPKVPLYWGTLEEEQKPDLLFLVDQLNADPFLRNELASIQYRSNSFFIGLRSFGFEVEIGQVRRLKEKISKLKVFCAYRESHPSTTEFSRINLKFKNQVVGS